MMNAQQILVTQALVVSPHLLIVMIIMHALLTHAMLQLDAVTLLLIVMTTMHVLKTPVIVNRDVKTHRIQLAIAMMTMLVPLTHVTKVQDVRMY